MPTHILWRGTLTETLARQVADTLGESATLHVEKDKGRIAPYLQNITILVDGSPSDEALDAPKLEHVIVPWAGISAELRDKVLSRPHLSLHNSHYNAPLVAQHALALLLACACRLIESDMALRKGDWTPRYDANSRSLYLRGRRALLVGYGAIGMAIARHLKAFEVRLSALKRQPAEPDAFVDAFYRPHQLQEALAHTDIVMVSVPSTPETKGMLGASALSRMKPGGIIVNVGRGDVIDQDALFHALEQGRLMAAGLDVWWRYPEDAAVRRSTLPARLPFHLLPNVILSPHRANEMVEDLEMRAHDVSLTLQAILRGEARNRVDPHRGY